MKNQGLSTRTKLAAAAMAIVLGVIVVVVVQVGFAKSPSHASAGSPNFANLPKSGQLSATLTTDDGLSITIDRTEQSNSQMFFHIRIINQSANAIEVIGITQVHQFVLVGATPAGTPETIGRVVLTSPSASDPVHPPLAQVAEGKGQHAGWLIADLDKLGQYKPSLLLYRFREYNTKACADPRQPNTCTDATLFSALIWNL